MLWLTSHPRCYLYTITLNFASAQVLKSIHVLKVFKSQCICSIQCFLVFLLLLLLFVSVELSQTVFISSRPEQSSNNTLHISEVPYMYITKVLHLRHIIKDILFFFFNLFFFFFWLFVFLPSFFFFFN